MKTSKGTADKQKLEKKMQEINRQISWRWKNTSELEAVSYIRPYPSLPANSRWPRSTGHPITTLLFVVASVQWNTTCDETQVVMKHKFWWNTSCDETQVVMKHKLWWNTSCDETQLVIKHNLWWNTTCDETQLSYTKNLFPKKTFSRVFFPKKCL